MHRRYTTPQKIKQILPAFLVTPVKETFCVDTSEGLDGVPIPSKSSNPELPLFAIAEKNI